jgi:hypothetical protein
MPLILNPLFGQPRPLPLAIGSSAPDIDAAQPNHLTCSQGSPVFGIAPQAKSFDVGGKPLFRMIAFQVPFPAEV